MNGPQHYTEAERLIAAGEEVVKEIRAAKGYESRRDALGKQAMGIWAQAQVHATLALVATNVDTAGLDIWDDAGTDRVTDWGKAVRKS